MLVCHSGHGQYIRHLHDFFPDCCNTLSRLIDFASEVLLQDRVGDVLKEKLFVNLHSDPAGCSLRHRDRGVRPVQF